TKDNYFFKDHVGSIDAITDANGKVLENLSFDSWGQRRNAQSWAKYSAAELIALLGPNTSSGFGASNLAAPGRTTQGFTGHTMLDDTGLIHMGGRIYDPKLARFMQADPYIQAGTNTQSYNRYGYTFNNPLNATDPSGYSAAGFRHDLRQASGAILAVIATVACQGATPCGASVYAAWMAAAAATGAYIAGANNGGVLRAAAIGFATGYAQGVASGFDNIWAKAALVGVSGGMAAQLQGGDGAHSIISAGLGALVGSAGIGGNPVLDIGIAAVIGGTASELTGGKFKNGAGTAAFYAVVTMAMNGAAHFMRGGGASHPDQSTPIERKKMYAILEKHRGETVHVDFGDLDVSDVGGFDVATVKKTALETMRETYSEFGVQFDEDLNKGGTIVNVHKGKGYALVKTEGFPWRKITTTAGRSTVGGNPDVYLGTIREDFSSYHSFSYETDSHEMVPYKTAERFGTALGNVIAHETGHSFGIDFHTSGGLMFAEGTAAYRLKW
ncbi:MAG TPA: RHS repeat-associated core domain-containing protein, partial [Cellvibrionaceae bacterium]